jgi:hypothetical protein
MAFYIRIAALGVYCFYDKKLRKQDFRERKRHDRKKSGAFYKSYKKQEAIRDTVDHRIASLPFVIADAGN